MLSVLYRDAHMVVCVKPAGVLSQEAGESSMPALLRAQLGAEYVAVVHRLDREVGGIMVYALSQRGAAALSRAVQERRLEKTYLAVLRGVPEEPSGTLEDLLFHDKTRNKTYVTDRLRKGVRDASLDYTLLKAGAGHALVRVRLHTGRTHQIRVQFASRRLPLVGDGKYGGREPGMPLLLWSWQLTLPHPVTGEQLSFTQEPQWEELTAQWFS